MRTTKTTSRIHRLVQATAFTLTSLLASGAQAAAPGVTSAALGGSTFSLGAEAAYITQPDGASVYSWGYGCAAGAAVAFAPPTIAGVPSSATIPELLGYSFTATASDAFGGTSATSLA